MFGMSFGEILIIAVIAILFIGPDKLPEAMVKVAKFFKSFKKTIHETKETIEQEMHLAELKEEAVSYKEKLDNAVSDFKIDSDINVLDDINQNIKEIEHAVTQSDEPKKSKKSKKAKKSKKEKVEKEGDNDV
jgi:sec-independent protein translocase protein TatB